MTVMALLYRGSSSAYIPASGPYLPAPPPRDLCRAEILLYSGADHLAATGAPHVAVGSELWLAAIDDFVARCAGIYTAIETDDPADSVGGI